MTDLVKIPGMRPEPERDKYHRYVLPHPETGRRTSWTRATTLKGALADKEGLIGWKQRHAAVGMALRPELAEQVLVLNKEIVACGDDWRSAKEFKDELNAILDVLHDAAGGNEGSDRGTQAHTLTEYADCDRLDEVRHLATEDELADLQAYLDCCDTAGIIRPAQWVERIVVNTKVESAGTFDRLVYLPDGRLVVGDVKGLALDTPLPTPTGWTTMADVQPGDQVFDAYGQPCNVTAKSAIKQIGTYVVKFDDGSEIVCDTEHIWWTQRDFHGTAEPEARTISEVIETLTDRRGQKWHRVPLAGALELPEADLAVDPYLLGVWLGNGDRSGGTVTGMPDLLKATTDLGWEVGKVTVVNGSKAVRWSVLGLRTHLRKAGILGHKSIPDQYLRASREQRLALLRGLMDSDGTWNQVRKRASFCTVSKALAVQVAELLHTLGQRAKFQEVHGTGYGKEVTSYPVEFTPVDLNPFLLPRKAELADTQVAWTKRSRRRVIVSVEPGPDVPTACIAVDSPTRTYLCGEQMIPTHNSQKDFAFGYLDVAAQLGQYVNADAVWDYDTESWNPLPAELDRTIGIVMHVPVGKATCELIEIDLVAGWEAAKLAYEVRDTRARGKQMGRPYRPRPRQSTVEQDLYLIRTAQTVESLEGLWRDLNARGCWTALHTRTASDRKRELAS